MKLSVKQINSIGKIIPNYPKYKITLWEAFHNAKKFSEFKKNDEINSVSKAIGIWSAMVGYKIEENEIIFINQFIRNSFPKLNLQDIEEAVNMVGDGRIKTEYHGTFAPLYIGKVLGQYKRIRSEFFHEIRNAIISHDKLLPMPKPSPEESLRLTILIIKEAHREAIRGIFSDGGSLVYQHLLKHKLLDFSETGVKDADEYANVQLKMKRKKTVHQSVINSALIPKQSSKEYKLKMLMREYAVNKWLRSKSHKDMRLYLENLKPEDD